MNKIIIAIIIVVIGIGVTISMEDKTVQSENESILDETVNISEAVEEETEQTGRNITVELSESVGLRSP